MTHNSLDKDQICWVPRWQLIKSKLNNLTWNQFKKRSLEDDNAIILDVRTCEEFNKGHLGSAKNLNYLNHNLAEEIDMLDKTKTYYVYCKTGRRSLRICVLLKNSGFHSIYNLDEGVGDYLEEFQIA